ncbi:hypothetical protein IW143_001554 [Coemansia sp. RSA 520]|nr:hypothetical protein GGH15_002447 [Coemansia sp. RSA 562]KAJ2222101.1 hypothetical protein IW143_001554 [Coemansia sp. RSA 520]
MKKPLLLVKLPRHIVESLQTASPEDLSLVLGGKERITTGTLHVGATHHDVRYSAERSSAPPLLFQGSTVLPEDSDGWAHWTQRGRLVGKLTVVVKAKPGLHSHYSNVSAASDIQPRSSAAIPEPRIPAPEALESPPSVPQNTSAYISKSVPQKKPGIFRQNRELLRDTLLHILATGPVDESQLLDRIKSPSNVVIEALSMIGQKSNSMWSLRPEKFKLVQIDSWHKYDTPERLCVAASALKAFDELGLSADDSDRVRVEQLQQRLMRGPGSAQKPKPATALTASAKESPAPKKKTMRTVIAPTLVRPLHSEASRHTKRPSVSAAIGTGASAPPTAMAASFEDSSFASASVDQPTSAKEPLKSTMRPNRPMPLLAEKLKDSQTDEGAKHGVSTTLDPGSALARRPMTSAPSTVPNTAIGAASHGMERQQKNTRLPDAREYRDGIDNYPASDAEAEYRRKPRRRGDSPIVTSRKPVSRSHSRNSRVSPRGQLSTASRDERKQHMPVRSRPIQLQSLASTSSRTPDAETGAAVSRVQERLAQEMMDRRIPAAKARSRSSSDPTRHSAPPRPRGPSLSPIADLPQSPSPPPVSKVEQADTIEDLARLQTLLVDSYAEYSQLRLKIDSHCAAFAPLAAELVDAQAACKAVIAEKQNDDAEREEGEEIPGDARTESSLGFDAITEKCAPDGARLYWVDTASGAWLADSQDAVVGKEVGRDGQPCRTQMLLPEEARVLKANQAIVDQYTELGSDDLRRWVRRYLRLHSQIEQLDHELNSAYKRISKAINAQYDSFREELGDSDVDAVLAEACPGFGSHEPPTQSLNIDMYRDETMALLPESAPATSHI